MPTPLTFQEFTDTVTLFRDKDAANSFFQNLTVPDPTTTVVGSPTRGAVYLASVPAAPVLGPVVLNYDQINIDGVPYYIVRQADLNSLKAQIDELKTFIVAFRAAVITAGQAQ